MNAITQRFRGPKGVRGGFPGGSARGFPKIVIVCTVFNNLRLICFQICTHKSVTQSVHCMEVLPLLGTTGFLLMSLKSAPGAGVYVMNCGILYMYSKFYCNNCGGPPTVSEEKGARGQKTTAIT